MPTTILLEEFTADNGAMDGVGSQEAALFVELNRMGHMFEYYPEVSTSIAGCPLESEVWQKAIFRENNLPVDWRRGHQYLCSHIGSKATKTHFVVPKV